MFDFILPQGSQSIWLKPDPVMSSPPSFPRGGGSGGTPRDEAVALHV